MNGWFDSGGLKVARYLALPNGRATPATPGLVLCHGFPVGPLDARQSASTFPELSARIATEMGWAALTFTFRGCGQSEGDFSLLGWLEDLRAAVDHLVEERDHFVVFERSSGQAAQLAANAVDRVHCTSNQAATVAITLSVVGSTCQASRPAPRMRRACA